MKAEFPRWIKATIHSNVKSAPVIKPTGKILGLTPLSSEITWSQTKERGATHAYTRDGISVSESHETILAKDYAINPTSTQNEVYVAGSLAGNSGRVNCDSVIFDQIVEGAGAIPFHAYWDRAAAFYRGLFDSFGCAPFANNMFGSYKFLLNSITGTNKFNVVRGGYNSNPLNSYFVDGLSSESNARKPWNFEIQQQGPYDFNFFTPQGPYPAMSSYMGLLTFAYNGLDEPDESLFPYSIFYEIQRKYAAGVSKTVIFHWICSESVNLATDVPWRNTGWVIERNDVAQGSYWEAKSHHVSPTHNTLFLAFVGFLLTEGIVNWDSNRESYSPNPADMKDSEFLTSNNRLKWISPTNATKPSFNTGSKNYPHWPISPQDLYFVALTWYSEFKKRLDLGMDLQYFQYTANGVTVPVNTSLTQDKRLFTKSVKPFGQHNILHLAHNKRPLCIGGVNGNNYAVMYFDPFGDPRVSSDLTVHFESGLGSVNVGRVKPRELCVFYSNIEEEPNEVNFILNSPNFDPSAPYGISPHKMGLIQWMSDAGIDIIQLHLQIGPNYSPSKGVYNDDKLSEAIDYLCSKTRKGKVELLIIPVFGLGDSRLAESDMQVDADGHKPDCIFALDSVPSMYSPNAINELEVIYEHLFAYIAENHADQVRMIYKSSGSSGEDYMPYASNYPGGPGCSDAGFGGIGDYSPHALTAWRNWLMEKYGNTVPFPIGGISYSSLNAPLPYIQPDNQNNRYVDFNQREIREVVRFWNQGVFDSWKRMKDIAKLKMPNLKVGSFFADSVNIQAVKWTMNAGTIKKQLDEADALYHSYNISPSFWGHLLVGTDVLKGGTFGPNKISSIEFDGHDLGAPSGQTINRAHFKAATIKFIEHGGNDIHFAMDWNQQQVADLGIAISEIRAEKINNPQWTPLYVSQRPIAPVVHADMKNMFQSPNFIDIAWESTGNSLSNPFAANIVNVRINDTFWEE